MSWSKFRTLIFLVVIVTGCTTISEGPYIDHSVLINTAHWIQNTNQTESFVYVDLRAPELYNEGHLPGAINLTRNDVRNKTASLSGMAIEADNLAILLGKQGISPSDWLILYDEKGGVEASRLWWILRIYGHNRVKILNGDLRLFDEVLEYDPPQRQAQAFNFSGKAETDWAVDYDEFEKLRARPSTVLLDCRSAAEFAGEYIKPGAYLAGHVPGAVNICYSHTVEKTSAENLKIKSPEALAAVYAHYAQPEDTILVYCQSGVRSAHTLLILREILNYKHVYNYDGSWIEWSYRNQELKEADTNKKEAVI